MTADHTTRQFKEIVARLDEPTAPVEEPLQPGVARIRHADGRSEMVYEDQIERATPAPLLAVPAPAQPIPAWAKTTALLTFSTSAGIGIASVCLAYAADGLEAIARGLMALAVIVACVAAAVIAVAMCFKRDRGPRQVTHIHQTVTATGWLGRAKGGGINTTMKR